MTSQSTATTDVMVVPQDYNRAEKFLPSRDIIGNVVAQHILHVCGYAV